MRCVTDPPRINQETPTAATTTNDELDRPDPRQSVAQQQGERHEDCDERKHDAGARACQEHRQQAEQRGDAVRDDCPRQAPHLERRATSSCALDVLSEADAKSNDPDDRDDPEIARRSIPIGESRRQRLAVRGLFEREHIVRVDQERHDAEQRIGAADPRYPPHHKSRAVGARADDHAVDEGEEAERRHPDRIQSLIANDRSNRHHGRASEQPRRVLPPRSARQHRGEAPGHKLLALPSWRRIGRRRARPRRE